MSNTNQPIDSHLRYLIVLLDAALTGKDTARCEHTAQNQAGTVEQWFERPEYYLSDGGYSRVWLADDGHLFVTSNSLDRVKAAWLTVEVREIVRQITGDVYLVYDTADEIAKLEPNTPALARTRQSCGCVHEDIARAFPEYRDIIKWHLCSSDGPMHYIANTVYMAGNRDCWGLLAGEFRQFRNKNTGLPSWVIEIPNEYSTWGKKHSIDAEVAPAPVTFNYVPYGQTGVGKVRELQAARSHAVWPEATDEELTADGLKERLEARLPGLLAEFRAAMEGLGFVW